MEIQNSGASRGPAARTARGLPFFGFGSVEILASHYTNKCHSEDRVARFPRPATRIARKSGALARSEESQRRNGGNLDPGRAFDFLISIFAVSLLLGGCASPGEPLERKPPVPQAVTDLAAEQSGNDVILTFTLPKETVDHRPLHQPLTVEIYRDFEAAVGANPPTAPQPSANPTLLVTIPPAMLDRYTTRDRVRYADSLTGDDFAQHPGASAVYTVRARASVKKDSADSNAASVPIYPAPLPIEDAKAEITRAGVALSWTPPEKTSVGPAPPVVGYRIYRTEAEPPAAAGSSEVPEVKSPLVKIGESQDASYTDASIEFGKAYVYSVRSIVQYPGETLESSDSNLVAVAPQDIFPPPAPLGLEVVFVPARGEVPAHLELSWAISPATNVAGYNVYRSEQAGVQGTRMNPELLPTPAFRDMNTVAGERYFYSVTAVDKSGKESDASAIVSGEAPAESQPQP